MSGEVVGWAMKQVTGSPTSKLVLVKLADNANEEGLCWPSMNKLITHTELSERAVRKHLLILEKMGLITIERRNVDGVQLKNRFQLNLQYAVPLHEVHGVHDVQTVHEVQAEAAQGAVPPMHDVHAKIDNPQTEPSVEPSLTREDAPQVDWKKVWKAFKTWPGLPAGASEQRARAVWERMAGDLPGDLVARITAHGAALSRDNAARGRAGPVLVVHPHNWLERERGWEAYSPAGEADAVEIDPSTWEGEATKLASAVGADVFRAWFGDARFAPGPPTIITLPKMFQAKWVVNHYGQLLQRLYGQDIEIKVAA